MQTAQDYIDLVEHHYFGNMTRDRPLDSVALFDSGAYLTGCLDGFAPQRWTLEPAEGEKSLTDFFTVVLEEWSPTYSDFWHSVDVPAQRMASTYTIHLARRDGTDERHLRNANFFQFNDRGLLDSVLFTNLADPAFYTH